MVLIYYALILCKLNTILLLIHIRIFALFIRNIKLYIWFVTYVIYISFL